MLANHTSIATLFERTLDSFNLLRKKKAFIDRFLLDGFDHLEELNSAHDIVKEVIEEYQAATKINYVNYRGQVWWNVIEPNIV